MAKLFGYPINVESDEEEGGGGSSINAEASRSGTQPDGGATSLPQRESNPYFRFLETNSGSGSGPIDSESDLRNRFIDFLGRESNEVDNEMQRVACDVDICGESDVMEEIELGLGIGDGSGLQVKGDKETDSGRVDVGTDLSPSEDDLFCEEEDMLMADEVLEWETLQNDITWESEPVQASLFSRLEEEEEEEEEEVEEEEEEEVEEEEEEEEDTEEEEEGDELALPSRANPPLQSLESQFLSLVNNDGSVEDFYEESLDAMLMEAMEMEGASLMDLDYGDILHELGEDPGDFYDVFAQSFNQEPPIMGTRPASKRVVDDLPVVEITSEELSKGSIACAICIGDVVVEEKVTRLPCRHYYHGECILPWLGMKNTCPVCRYELPTDDLEYERNRRS